MNLAGNTETVFVVRIYSVCTFVTISKIPDVAYNKTPFINETDYAEVSGTRWIMQDLPNYAEGHQLCAKLCARIIA